MLTLLHGPSLTIKFFLCNLWSQQPLKREGLLVGRPTSQRPCWSKGLIVWKLGGPLERRPTGQKVLGGLLIRWPVCKKAIGQKRKNSSNAYYIRFGHQGWEG